MDFLRKHWYDLGIVLGLIVLLGLWFFEIPVLSLQFILWISLITLFIHQWEEYRWPGYFPGMVNSVLFKSSHPDRYPLNSNTALIINVGVGWLFYTLAALFYNQIGLGIATMMVSVGNLVAHTILFNVKGKTFYNPGMMTSVLLFLPVACLYFYYIFSHGLVTVLDLAGGLILGIILNVVGILKLIVWLKDDNTRYVFDSRQIKL